MRSIEASLLFELSLFENPKIQNYLSSHSVIDPIRVE